ncbi:ABC transporter substrate-binding protein/permease [Loigolactobacillus backii]|uniref:ABC transporter permease n=1 Tax=Loigolactobacillus backii TaxID=375175 RepID=A0A192H1Q5_9LACO|nr:ABC transporter substrate-binding protein/permease [Loigolactobacillus backii]ANK60558.1 ABC transporter permease [Loigolactobacillus backii]ANK61876.1 ABC transporter permease [Loigolactobacillus backii]ANK65510.1 ABC transporter permease [Loigolactobacillus backii]ANK68930.1 ABC transporter permease [Loigolactobacillus backii]MDA5387508.1 ABC transporter substrate-binding protein/permease [Loigolactobacillus backii]
MKKGLQLFLVICLVFMGLGGIVQQPAQAATDDSLARIQRKGTLVMGNSPNYPPYEFQVNKNGKEKIVGMDIEIGKKIAHDLGVKLVIKKMSFDSLLVALETGKVDMILSGMSPTPERRKNVDFSNVYYSGGQDILINKADKGLYHNKDSFRSKKIGAETGTLQYDQAKKQMPGIKVVGMDNASDLILALKTHKVDGVAKDEASATAYAKNDPDLIALKGHFKTSKAEAGNAIALPKGSTSLRLAINKSLNTIKQKNLIQKEYLVTAGSYMKVNTQNTSMLHYWSYFAKGVLYTLGISLVAVIIGVLLGILLALIRLGHIKILRALATAYVEFVRGTPLMVQIMFVYFGIGVFVNIPALIAGTIAVALNSGAYVSEIIRGGINSVAKGQVEAARSLGLSQSSTMRYVVFPQALANIWPALGNEFISLIKETSIVSIIGVTDLIYQLRIVQADTYKGVIPIVIAMILYFIMTFSLSRVLRHYENRLRHPATE